MQQQLRFIDVAVNLTDCIFEGLDRKKMRRHESDLDLVIDRAMAAGVRHVIITGTSLEQSRRAISFCRKWSDKMEAMPSAAPCQRQASANWAKCTVGIHPAHADEFLCIERREALTAAAQVAIRAAKRKSKQRATTSNAVSQLPTMGSPPSHSDVTLYSSHGWNEDGTTTPYDEQKRREMVQAAHITALMSELRSLITDNRDVVVAVGEIGMDAAELQPGLITEALQAETYRLQWELAQEVELPVLLHSRACGPQFVETTRSLITAAPMTSVRASDCISPVHLNTTNTTSPVSLSASPKTIADTSIRRGLVHCFTGDAMELKALLEMGLAISVNAASFRTEAGAMLVGSIPVGRLTLETDAPWCDVRPDQDYGARWVDFSSSSPFASLETWFPPTLDPKGKNEEHDLLPFERGMLVARRNEPCHIYHVAEMVVGARLMYQKRMLEKDAPTTADIQDNKICDTEQQNNDNQGVKDSEQEKFNLMHRVTEEIFQTTLSTFPGLEGNPQ